MAMNPLEGAVGSDADAIVEMTPSNKRRPDLIKGPYIRGPRQRQIDAVVIRAPIVWLHHNASASLQFCKSAQSNMELRLWREEGNKVRRFLSKFSSKTDSRIPDALQKMSGLNYEALPVRNALRIICGGDVLPWGLWPVRLRNLEGESFYGGEKGGDGHPLPYWHGGGAVAGSNDVAGVDAVNEHSIHDELVWQRLQTRPSSALSRNENHTSTRCRGTSLSEDAHGDYHRQDGTVRRLLPGKRGQWIDVTPKAHPMIAPDPPSPLDASGPVAGADEVSASLPTEYSSAMDVTKLKMNAAQGYDPKKRKRSAVTADEATTELQLPASEDEDGETSFIGMELKGKSDGQARRTDSIRNGRGKGGIVREKGMTGSGGGGCADPVYRDGARKRGQEDRTQGWTVAEPTKETVRRVWARARRRSRDVFVPGFHPRAPAETKGESAAATSGETSENAEKKHEAAAAGGRRSGSNDDASAGLDRYAVSSRFGVERSDDGLQTASAGQDAAVPATERVMMDNLDPELLSLLSRECEGIIDAALHVVLSHQLDRLGSGPSAPATTSDAHSASDWQDVLRTFWCCSAAARKTARKNGSDLPEGSGGARLREVWGLGESSDGAVVVVNEGLPALPLNEAVVTRTYNRLLHHLYEKKPWHA